MREHFAAMDRCAQPSPELSTTSPERVAAMFLRPVGVLAMLVLTLTGCQQQQATAPHSPPPGVVAVKAQLRAIEEQAQFVGRVVAVERVELRARVEGFLQKRGFTEGQQVSVGDVLFQIEPDEYQAVVQQRQADVEKAKADARNADAQLARARELLESNNIARAKVDELEAAAAVAKASIAQAEAALTAAKLELGYTQITSPIQGRIGLARITIGNLVAPSTGVLATIVSRDPVYVQFPVTQRTLLSAKRRIKTKGGDLRSVLAKVRLPDGTLYAHDGRLDFVDVTTDQSTDSVTVRAEMPNPDGTLIDGQYVSVVLQSGEPESAILIPQSALQVDQQGVFVLIVDAENKAQIRRVQTGQNKGMDVAVTQGLEAGELVITQGAQKVRPGQAVKVAPPTYTGEGQS